MKLNIPKKKLVTLIILILSVVLIGIGTWYYLAVYQNQATQEEVNSLRSDVQQHINTGEAEEASTIAKNFYDSKRMSDEIRWQVAQILGGIYAIKGDYAASRDWYLKAGELNPSGLNYELALGIAQAAIKLNDRTLAIDYYKKAIELAKNDNNEFNDLYIPGYEQTIKLLENPNVDLNQPQSLCKVESLQQ